MFLGAHQNTFRRCYLGLLGEDEETQRGILGVIKETAILMMTYDAQFRTTHPHNMARIRENISCLEEFLRRKGLYYEYDLLRFLGNNPLTSETTVAMATSKLTGKDSMLPVADMTKHTHEGMADYRQRLYSVLGPENIRDPLVVGVMAGGIYNAATLYVASILSGLNPDFALVKKSRHERNVSVFPPEGKNIRSALEEGRDVIVVDDFVFGFQTFFSIFDYFGRPQNMRFSALFYNSPLPKELTILERRILHYLTENPHKLPFADGGLRSTITTLSQYGGGLERDSRHTAVMRPTF